MTSSSILDIAGGLFLLIFGVQVVTTIKTHGGPLWRAVREMTRVTLRGPKALLLIGGVVGLMNALFQQLAPSWVPPIPPLLLIGISLVALNGACLPPAILYLAASRASGFSFASELQIAVAPLKVVHMLQSFEAGAILGDEIHESEYRVRANWQQAVRALSTIAPLIIVDGRVPSASVRQEIRHIIDSGLHDRTFFIADEHGALPALSEVSLPRAMDLRIATSEQLLEALRGLWWSLFSSRTRGMVQYLETRMGAAVKARESVEGLCDWMTINLGKGLTAEQIAAHVARCPVCGLMMESGQRQRSPTMAARIDPESFPTMMVIGIDGPFDLGQVLSLARREAMDLVVMGNRSPAFKDHDLLLREAPRFRSDTSLALIFEKFPSRNDPLCLDPLIMVRRSFLLEVAPRLQAATLGEFAIVLAIEASARNLRVSTV
ncbi:MAG TPA: hypothetical protein VF756_06615 [Thermoanaerobaculia bacterium]